MRLVIMILVFCISLFFVACNKDSANDENNGKYNFANLTEFLDFVNSHDWDLELFIHESAKDKSMMYIFPHAPNNNSNDINEHNITADDVFELVLNDVSVPVSISSIDNQVLLDFNDDNVVPLDRTPSIHVIFKRNQIVLLDCSVAVTEFPHNLQVPSNLDPNQAIPLTWDVNKDSHTQTAEIWLFSSDYDDYFSSVVPRSARSYSIPSSSVNVENWLYYIIRIAEYNFTEYQNNLVCTIARTEATNETKRSGFGLSSTMLKHPMQNDRLR